MIENYKKQKNQFVLENDPESDKKKRLRQERFQTKGPVPPPATPGPLKIPNAFCEDDFEQLCTKWQIVGTCQNLEKEYVRL